MSDTARSLAAQALLLPADSVPDDEPDAAAGGAERRVWRVALPQAGERLDKCLAAWLPEFSRSHAQWLLAQGAVTVDGVASQKRDAARKLRLGQAIEAELRLPESAAAYLPEAVPIDVVFEDEHVLIVNKPAGLVVHPGAGNWRGTLLNGLLHRYAAERCGPGTTPAAQLPRAGIVHRLDKDTSGLMVVARSAPAMAALVAAISQRDVSRQYLALAEGAVAAPTEASGDWRWVDAPIGRDPSNRLRMAVLGSHTAGAKQARTAFVQVGTGSVVRTEVAGRLVAAQTLLRCQLDTGRTHQIRVHLAHLGHPIAGDAVYGRASPLIGRQALHAERLAFEHPQTGEPLVFVAPLPPDFGAALAALGLHYNPDK